MEHVLQNHYEALKKAEQWAGLVDEHIGELSEATGASSVLLEKPITTPNGLIRLMAECRFASNLIKRLVFGRER